MQKFPCADCSIIDCLPSRPRTIAFTPFPSSRANFDCHIEFSMSVLLWVFRIRKSFSLKVLKVKQRDFLNFYLLRTHCGCVGKAHFKGGHWVFTHFLRRVEQGNFSDLVAWNQEASPWAEADHAADRANTMARALFKRDLAKSHRSYGSLSVVEYLNKKDLCGVLLVTTSNRRNGARDSLSVLQSHISLTPCDNSR